MTFLMRPTDLKRRLTHIVIFTNSFHYTIKYIITFLCFMKLEEVWVLSMDLHLYFKLNIVTAAVVV